MCRVGQEAHQQSADQAGEAVGVDHAQGVVDLGEGPDLGEVVPREPDEVEEMSPTKIAPVPFTQPALGVIATRPQSIPLMAPRNVGFFCLEKNMSRAAT
jgi:hypothetical protein